MRGAGIRGIGGLALAALAATGAAVGGAGDDIMRRQPDPAPKKRRVAVRRGRSQRSGSFDPVFNRHTGAPHEHAREKARRERQAARNRERQAERVKTAGRSYNPRFSPSDVPLGLSRRGRLVKP